jgi:hypothetical protein
MAKTASQRTKMYQGRKDLLEATGGVLLSDTIVIGWHHWGLVAQWSVPKRRYAIIGVAFTLEATQKLMPSIEGASLKSLLKRHG